MTDKELQDLEECSQMFDFIGFGPEDDRRLIREVKRLRQALKDVCSPVSATLRTIPEEDRRFVNSALLVHLCDKVSYVQDFARKALEVEVL